MKRQIACNLPLKRTPHKFKNVTTRIAQWALRTQIVPNNPLTVSAMVSKNQTMCSKFCPSSLVLKTMSLMKLLHLSMSQSVVRMRWITQRVMTHCKYMANAEKKVLTQTHNLAAANQVGPLRSQADTVGQIGGPRDPAAANPSRWV